MDTARKNFLLGVGRSTISRMLKKGRSDEEIKNFIKSKRGQDYMAKVATFVNSQVSY